MIQGFYFARPMPPEDYEKKMASGVATDEDVAESAAAGAAQAAEQAAESAEEPAEETPAAPAEVAVPEESAE
jgi:hypothetical protein